MNLSALIRKRDTGKAATATPATSATQDNQGAVPVAGIATVAVANPQGEAAEASFSAGAWLLHFTDHAPLEVHVFPAATEAEALADYPDAIAAEPLQLDAQSVRSATASESAELRALVAAIYASDTDAERGEALELALADPGGALTCYRSIAVERGIFLDVGGDQRTCRQCANLTGRGLCLAARRGEIVASRSYEPIPDLLRRCEGYAPGPSDPDRRTGRERWPGLTEKGRDDANT